MVGAIGTLNNTEGLSAVLILQGLQFLCNFIHGLFIRDFDPLVLTTLPGPFQCMIDALRAVVEFDCPLTFFADTLAQDRAMLLIGTHLHNLAIFRADQNGAVNAAEKAPGFFPQDSILIHMVIGYSFIWHTILPILFVLCSVTCTVSIFTSAIGLLYKNQIGIRHHSIHLVIEH